MNSIKDTIKNYDWEVGGHTRNHYITHPNVTFITSKDLLSKGKVMKYYESFINTSSNVGSISFTFSTGYFPRQVNKSG